MRVNVHDRALDLGRPNRVCYVARLVATKLKAKKKCCKDAPRCKKCPVVLKKLDKAGYTTRVSKRVYVLELKPPKKVLKAARSR